MYNDINEKKSWWKQNWKWFLPTFSFLILFLLVFLFKSAINGNIVNMSKAFSDIILFENAIQVANKNKRVQEVIGRIEPVDKLAILEGNVIYSENDNAVAISVRINGNKGKGKLDISACKIASKWVYKNINIRIKNPKEEIQVFSDSILTTKKTTFTKQLR